ncbi:MAG: DUF296 domain-containing protein [Candidatus Omnitrophica bacterium]|nr:DUF296 domain-containing protein [Candidatus Omnitrophota bacterium]
MEVKRGRAFIGRFEAETDLLEELNRFCRLENIRLGTAQVIGAVTRGRLGYYDQVNQKYIYCVELEKKLEIASCLANVSLKDGEIFVHAHVTFADLQGHCYAGHLMPGSVIFAAEYFIEELTGGILQREIDPRTGLMLWKG